MCGQEGTWSDLELDKIPLDLGGQTGQGEAGGWEHRRYISDGLSWQKRRGELGEESGEESHSGESAQYGQRFGREGQHVGLFGIC